MNELVTNRYFRIAGTAALGMLALFLLVETAVTAQAWGRSGTPPTNTITVSGDGQTTVAPDIANITFSVMATGTTVADVQSAATTQTNAALAAVKNLGISDSDVRTLSYNISPRYAQGNCGPNVYCPQNTGKIVGYDVAETIEVKVHDLGKTGDVLQALGTTGVQSVYGPDLGLDNPNEGTDAARADAIANAKGEAQKLAAQLGVHLGKVVSFNENGGGYPIMYAKGASMAAGTDSASAPTIPTGENEYTSSVTITYEIW